MNELVRGSLEFLEAVYSEDRALFPFTTHLRGGSYANDYGPHRAIRCTVNCLLGLTEIARRHPEHPFASQVDVLVERFLDTHAVADPGDLGLLSVTLSDDRYPMRRLEEAVGSVRALVANSSRVRTLDVQDVCWLLWGAIAAHERGAAGAESAARSLFALLRDHYLTEKAVLPRHHLGRGRRSFVSFGASVYYAHVAYLYGTRFADAGATELFERAANALMRSQGPNGEWPWMLRCSDAMPLDVYPVFSVHQTSMSMLVLHPARREGLPGTEDAITRSVGWVAGRNQLSQPMGQRHPFFIFRSLERADRFPQARRYLRSTLHSLRDEPAALAEASSLRVNRESRSYELGWVLYILPQMEPVPSVELS